MATPARPLRPVPFSTAASAAAANPRGAALSALPPSPYTPSRLPAHRTQSTATAPAPPSIHAYRAPTSAAAFAAGGAEAVLRAAALDAAAALGPADATGFAQEATAALEVQLSFARDFEGGGGGGYGYARRAVVLLREGLRLERETWTLVLSAWRDGGVGRGRDLGTKRAAVGFEDDRSGVMPGAEVCRRVLEWLEGVAGEGMDAGDGGVLGVQPLDDPAYRWGYTAARVGGVGVVSPDFPLRAGFGVGGGGLEEVEVKAETRLARAVFLLVRAGRAEEAEEVCRHAGQPWRAAMLAGGQRVSEVSAAGVKGDARRIWRKAARALAEGGGGGGVGLTMWERAVFGVLAGVLEPVLAVAQSHEDRVWARLAVLLDRAVERSLTGRAAVGAGSVGGDAEAMEDGEEAVEGVMAAAAAVDVGYEEILGAFSEAGGGGEGAGRDTGDALEGLDAKVVARVRTVRAYLALGPGMPTRMAVALLSELAALGGAAHERQLEWACRFAAQIALFLKKAGVVAGAGADGARAFDTVMVAYARVAIDQEVAAEVAPGGPPVHPILYDLVARHLAELHSVPRLVEVYTQVMASALRGDLQQEWVLVSKPGAMVRQIHERRTLSLQRAGKCFAAYGRNVLDSIVVAAVDRVWARHLPGYVARRTSPGGDRDGGGEMLDLEGAEQEEEAVSGGALIVDTPTEYDEMSHDDELVVRAIEFLIFPGFANYEEALRRTTTAARRFFLMGKRAAARHVVEWLPADALAEIAPGRCGNELHELDCWRAYMDAMSRHNEWRTYFFSQRPAPLDPAVRAAALANPGEVSYEVQAAANLKLEAYMEHMEKYTRVSESTRDAAITALRVTLLFDGGWMRDGDGAASGCDAEESQQREREIAAIRRMGVPQLAALLHHVLHESGLHAEATELVTVIADDGLRLYEDFDRAELGAFLQRIAESAVLLADTTIKSGQAVHPYPAQVFEEVAVDKAGALF